MVKADNGPPFNSHKFEEYAREEGFKHEKANGDAERCMQRIKKKKQQELPHYKADRSVTNCAGESEHTEQLYAQPQGPARINFCLGRNCAESSKKPADKVSTQMTPQSVTVTESKKRQLRNMSTKEDIHLR